MPENSEPDVCKTFTLLADMNKTMSVFHPVLRNYLDSTCVLIGQQVCFHSAMKHENDVSDMIGCLQVVRIYSFMKERKLYIHASYIVFLFVVSKINTAGLIKSFLPRVRKLSHLP